MTIKKTKELTKYEKLAEAVRQYFSEFDNSAPDYVMRKIRRDDMRKALEAIKHT